MRLRVFLFYGMLGCGSLAWAFAGDRLPPAVRRFEQRYRSSRTLQSEFLERYLENGKEIRSEAGLAYFGKPGKMRWEYESPERNLFVIDGKWSWFYVPADHTVIRVRARDSSDWRTPLALLAGEATISRLCEHVDSFPSVAPIDSHGAVFRCAIRTEAKEKQTIATSPLSASSGDAVLFELNTDTGALDRVLARDPGGIEIEFRFANWVFNVPVDPAKFRFEPPRGVAIVDGELASVAGEGATGAPVARRIPN